MRPNGPWAPPVKVRCHASSGCRNPATGWLKRKGRGQMWVATCGIHVGPWTIQGASFVIDRDMKASR